MKILCLLDSVVKPGERWLWKYLPSNNDELDFLITTGAADRFQKWGKVFNYYPAYLRLGIQAFLKTRRTPYDLVVAWEGKNGFPYAVLRSLVGQRHPPLIILAFNVRGVIGHFRGLVRFGLRSVSRVVVFTPAEVEQYQRQFSLAPEAISYCAHGWYDPMRWYDPKKVHKSDDLAQAGKFILTSGRSYRDYGTLARAVAGTDVSVKVSGRNFNLAGINLPANMQATGWLDYRELQHYLYQSNFYVVPLQPITHAGGDSSLLQAMSFGKAIVATRAPSTETYIQDGVTGLLVEPHDIEGLRAAILRLWQNPDEAKRMGSERDEDSKKIIPSTSWLNASMTSCSMSLDVPRLSVKYKALLLIIFVAILFRIPAALYLGDKVEVLPGTHDQVSYDALARSLLAGRGFSFTHKWYPFTPANTPTAHWSFVYPLGLAGLYSVVGYHPLVARLLQATVASALICFLIYLIGRRVANENTGLVGAALAAVYGYFVYYSVALMTETFFIVLVLLTLYLGLRVKDRPTLPNWILLGLALGMGSLLRQTLLLFVPCLLFWLFWELRKENMRRWHVLVPVAIIAALIAPWTVRNYLVYHQFLLLNSNAGYALYASNNPNLATDWRNEEVVIPVPTELIGRNEAELDRALTRKAFEFILANPTRYFWLTLDKALEYFMFWPSRESSQVSNLNRVLSFGLYLPFMIVGLCLSFARWRSFAILYLFMAIQTGVHLLSWPAARYRLPVDAVLMIFAGLALFELARQFANWHRRHFLETNPGYSRR